jgi:hypothetical protein
MMVRVSIDLRWYGDIEARPHRCVWLAMELQKVFDVLRAVGGGRVAKEEWRCCEWWTAELQRKGRCCKLSVAVLKWLATVLPTISGGRANGYHSQQ